MPTHPSKGIGQHISHFTLVADAAVHTVDSALISPIIPRSRRCEAVIDKARQLVNGLRRPLRCSGRCIGIRPSVENRRRVARVASPT